jgi:hypothetical protein
MTIQRMLQTLSPCAKSGSAQRLYDGILQVYVSLIEAQKPYAGQRKPESRTRGLSHLLSPPPVSHPPQATKRALRVVAGGCTYVIECLVMKEP